MRVEQAITVDSPVEEVWVLLQDIPKVVSCLPGADLYSQEDSGETYRGAIDVAFGPTRASFEGSARIAPDSDSQTVHIEARGNDQTGRSRAKASVAVSARAIDPLHTRLLVDGTIEVIGPLASFAETGGVHIATELMNSFARCLASTVDQRSGEAPGTDSAPVPLMSVLLAALIGWLKGIGRRFRNMSEVHSK